MKFGRRSFLIGAAAAMMFTTLRVTTASAAPLNRYIEACIQAARKEIDIPPGEYWIDAPIHCLSGMKIRLDNSVFRRVPGFEGHSLVVHRGANFQANCCTFY